MEATRLRSKDGRGARGAEAHLRTAVAAKPLALPAARFGNTDQAGRRRRGQGAGCQGQAMHRSEISNASQRFDDATSTLLTSLLRF